MSDPRWITTEETKELIDRAVYLLKNTYMGWSVVKVGNVQVLLDANSDVYVSDAVAHVMIFDYSTGGIRELYGSSARNALLDLRKNMVLDDLANV